MSGRCRTRKDCYANWEGRVLVTNAEVPVLVLSKINAPFYRELVNEDLMSLPEPEPTPEEEFMRGIGILHKRIQTLLEKGNDNNT